ncbi:MoaD/ThiS family protein [Algivirga pacifica]|uniref:Molybdopterin synthase sulfur carrier subunit n=1 Tax=Algivirga pacifica TaxID=1162670 RepID=A0ABP9D4S4_9BACT
MNELNILYFGMLTDITGCQKESFQIEGNTPISELKILLESKYPPLKEVEYKTTYNRTLADDNLPITDDAEIALLPPFSGG